MYMYMARQLFFMLWIAVFCPEIFFFCCFFIFLLFFFGQKNNDTTDFSKVLENLDFYLQPWHFDCSVSLRARTAQDSQLFFLKCTHAHARAHTHVRVCTHTRTNIDVKKNPYVHVQNLSIHDRSCAHVCVRSKQIVSICARAEQDNTFYHLHTHAHTSSTCAREERGQ